MNAYEYLLHKQEQRHQLRVMKISAIALVYLVAAVVFLLIK